MKSCEHFLFENQTSLSSAERVLGSSFCLPILVSFSWLRAGFCRSGEWLAFKNHRLTFGEKESCGSCGEEKNFGSWWWIKVSQQGPRIVLQRFRGRHWIWVQRVAAGPELQPLLGQNDSNRNKFCCCNSSICLSTLQMCWRCRPTMAFYWGVFPVVGKDLNDEEIQWETIKRVKITSHANKSEMLRIVLQWSCVGDAVLMVVVYSLL